MKKYIRRLCLPLLVIVLIGTLGLAACSESTTSTSTTPTTTSSTPTSTETTTTTSTATTTSTSTTTTSTSTSTTTTTTTTSTTPAYTIDVMHDDILGDYLVDGEGMTLYYHTKDTPGEKNLEALTADWFIFNTPHIVIPPTLKSADFSSIVYNVSTDQTTFKDYPLYTFANDEAPGEIKGEGFEDVWFVVNPDNFIPPEYFPLVSGWYKTKPVQYYNFGTNTPLIDSENNKVSVAQMYAFTTGTDAKGDPIYVEGQHNVIGTIPGDSTYSDLWQMNMVTVPTDYEADSIRSMADISSSGYTVTQTDTLVNCPVVPSGSTTETGKAPTQGWYQGKRVYYFDYGENPAQAGFVDVLINGKDAKGEPIYVPEQKYIIDVVPGNSDYSAFWRVDMITIPTTIVANTYKSHAAVRGSLYPVTETDTVINCPVITVGP